jgi:hypothetical protein
VSCKVAVVKGLEKAGDLGRSVPERVVDQYEMKRAMRCIRIDMHNGQCPLLRPPSIPSIIGQTRPDTVLLDELDLARPTNGTCALSA